MQGLPIGQSVYPHPRQSRLLTSCRALGDPKPSGSTIRIFWNRP